MNNKKAIKLTNNEQKLIEVIETKKINNILSSIYKKINQRIRDRKEKGEGFIHINIDKELEGCVYSLFFKKTCYRRVVEYYYKKDYYVTTDNSDSTVLSIFW